MRVLLVAGTPDAIHIAGALSRHAGVTATAVLPGPVRNPVPLGIPARIGGWGSEEAFRDWIERERVAAIIDASHPFTRTITSRAAHAAREIGIDYVRFLRPPWMPGADDHWSFLNDLGEVAAHAPKGKRVMIDTRGRGIGHIGTLPGRDVVFRVSEPPSGADAIPETWRLRHAPPGSTASEEALLSDLGIDIVVMPNIGGSEELPKIEAARRLGVDIAMIRRPPQPEGLKVSTISEVMNWVRRRV